MYATCTRRDSNHAIDPDGHADHRSSHWGCTAVLTVLIDTNRYQVQQYQVIINTYLVPGRRDEFDTFYLVPGTW